MLRLMGAALLVGGCGAVGFSAAGRLARRVGVLRALLGALEGMERELAFRLTPMPELLERAHYVTEMKKIKHPYDAGRAARTGVEY